MPDKSWALQRKLLRAPKIGFNAEIYNWFKDVDDEHLPKRKALRDSLLIQAKESRTSALFKIQYFREQVQKVHQSRAIVGIPKDDFDESVQYRVHINLYFQQHSNAVPIGESPVDALVSFRLSETTETISNAKLRSLASEIKSSFGGHPTYSWDKGKILCLYTDKKNGYYFQIYAQNVSEGEALVRKVISLNEHTFESDYFRFSEPRKNSVNKPSTHTILGKQYKKNRWRPTAKVYFQYAQAVVHGIPQPITLVDYSGTKSNSLVAIT